MTERRRPQYPTPTEGELAIQQVAVTGNFAAIDADTLDPEVLAAITNPAEVRDIHTNVTAEHHIVEEPNQANNDTEGSGILRRAKTKK